jgi:TonB family protein
MSHTKPAILRSGAACLALTVGALPFARSQNNTTGYKAAAVTTATDIAYPPQSSGPGMVTLDVSVDPSGSVQKIVAVRDVPPFTNTAISAVNNWKFAPASNGGQPVAGVARINIIFNPFNPGNVSIPNKPLPSPENPATNVTGVFQPADVQAANYATYPPNTTAFGTVVLHVRVGASGGVTAVKALHRVAALASPSVQAVKSWQFVPATYEGKVISSHTTVAFVFANPAVGTQ